MDYQCDKIGIILIFELESFFEVIVMKKKGGGNQNTLIVEATIIEVMTRSLAKRISCSHPKKLENQRSRASKKPESGGGGDIITEKPWPSN